MRRSESGSAAGFCLAPWRSIPSELRVRLVNHPAPRDDGATRHLVGARVPSVLLQATNDESGGLPKLDGRTVVYAYPRTGRPGVENPEGWDLTLACGAARPRLVRSVTTSLNLRLKR